MHVTNFTSDHIDQAMTIAKTAYERECKLNPQLPRDIRMPDFTPFAENGLGAAALEDGKLTGYLCAFGPFTGAFGGTIPEPIKAVFSPLHGRGTTADHSGKIYQKLYQYAAKKWVGAGAVSHAVSFYPHEEEGIRQFFRYGFGMRCIDAIRTTQVPEQMPGIDCRMAEIKDSFPEEVTELKRLLQLHMSASPAFMKYAPKNSWMPKKDYETGRSRFFIAQLPSQEIAAFLEITDEGETFLTPDPHIAHVCGAYCRPSYRGRGIYHNLLCFVLDTLQHEGLTHLGVDFESINAAAYGFWMKYFTPYNTSLVRRIDENIVR